MWRLRLMLVLCFVLIACDTNGDPPPLPTIPVLPTSDVAPIEDTVQATAVPNQIDVPGKLLFVRIENGTGNIWVHAGTEARRITTSGKKYHASWSPDGKQIAYIQREESFSDIWVMNADGTNKIRVTQNEPEGVPARSKDHIVSIKWAFQPQWSPDGAYLAYVSQQIPPTSIDGELYQEYPLSLFVYGTRRIGSGVIPGAEFSRFVKADTDIGSPTWSPDGRMIVYSQTERCLSCEGKTTLGYDLLDIAGGNDVVGVLQASDETTFNKAIDPTFSPDGKWLAYVKNEPNNSNIWIVPAPNADGTVKGTPIQLTSDGRIRKPTWSPDGTKLAYFLINDQVSMMVADVTISGTQVTLSNPVEIRRDLFDVESGMAWER
ncbi:MAG: PD40 domain-containing protein [Herpetosiphon sp.]|nr:PD40 domain-containing protein [Herpetosiphon sp.]